MSDVQYFSSEEYPQGSPEWFDLHCGIPTASNFHKIMAQGQGKTRDDYLRRKAGEIITGKPTVEYRNAAMDRGNEMEAELRDAFAMIENLEPRLVGFARREEPFGPIGASPDALIGDDSGLEIKSAEPHILIDILKRDQVPPEHVLQIQGNMMVTGRKSWWITVGYPGMPMFRRRVPRDEAKIAMLRIGIEQFHKDLNEMVAWLRMYGKK